MRSSIASTSLFSDVHHSDAGHIEMLSGSSRKCTKFCRSDLENETGAVADYFFWQTMKRCVIVNYNAFYTDVLHVQNSQAVRVWHVSTPFHEVVQLDDTRTNTHRRAPVLVRRLRQVLSTPGPPTRSQVSPVSIVLSSCSILHRYK